MSKKSSYKNIIQQGSCSTEELEHLLTWILPELKTLLKNKTAGFRILMLFQHGISNFVTFLIIFLIGPPEIRCKLLNSIIKLNVVETVSDKNTSETVCGIIVNGSCSVTGLEKFLSWSIDLLDILLKNRQSGFTILRLFQHGISNLGTFLVFLFNRSSGDKMQTTEFGSRIGGG